MNETYDDILTANGQLMSECNLKINIWLTLVFFTEMCPNTSL